MQPDILPYDISIRIMQYLTLRCFRKGLENYDVHASIQTETMDHLLLQYAVQFWQSHLEVFTGIDSENANHFGEKIFWTLQRFQKERLAITEERNPRLTDPDAAGEFDALLQDILNGLGRQRAEHGDTIVLKGFVDARKKIEELEALSKENAEGQRSFPHAGTEKVPAESKRKRRL